ncbi:MAG TPA: multicopper oxidase family protein [Ilumatobacteraceae bacterium]|nr:multicopper oxidase family protein [Ilumatobacteraceae bacterium]
MAGATALTVPSCGRGNGRRAVSAHDPSVAARETTLGGVAPTIRRLALVAGPVQLDLAGHVVETWGYTGDPIRATAGEVLEVVLRNELPENTTIHWHGIAIRNDMDGVHDLTQPPIAPDSTFTYRFLVPDPGTYFFHPHTGLQLDRALYAPLIIDDPADPGAYDAEHVLVLDDWLDGTPEETYASLRDGMGNMDMGDMSGMGDMGGMGGMHSGNAPDTSMPTPTGMGMSTLLGGHPGDVAYAMHLINQRPTADRPTFDAPAGGRVRLRLVNAASDTAYRVAVGGHRLTVTHADGFPIEPVEADAVLLGMGERYDVTVDVGAGVYPIVAVAEGKGQFAAAVLRSGNGEAPPADTMPAELDGTTLGYADLVPHESVRLAARTADLEYTMQLTGQEMPYDWGINGSAFAELDPFEVEQGQRVRLVLRNTSTMWHPMHLHGHTFALDGGARKDTVIVLPDEEVAISFDADNPGQWMFHCHNTYHLESGMAALLSYVR